jgi:hypothetical protein
MRRIETGRPLTALGTLEVLRGMLLQVRSRRI